jgi:NAD(P)-dependent dehydrogenase (short-subunit alcohol dehydrogenase family)
VLRVVIEVISERTGYPADMIEPDLDLESDLSIDSIKRTEVVGQLARRLAGDDAVGLASMGESELEELSKARTAGAIAAWLTARLAGPATAPVTSAAPASPVQQLVQGHAPVRLEFATAPLPAVGADTSALAGTRFLLLGDDGAGAAAALLAQLEAHGADVLAHEASYVLSPQDGTVDGVLLLDPLAADGPAVLPACVPALQAALAQPLRWLIAVSPLAPVDGRADGLRGLMRSLSREYPVTTVRVVEVDGHQDVAVTVVAELLAQDREPVVLHGQAGRQSLVLVEKSLGVLASTGAGPAGDGTAEAEALGLDRDAVVLLVGGARGITARFAATLASAGRCQLELFGRTPLPTSDEDPVTAAAQDRMALRAVLARQGVPLATVDSTASQLLAAREVNETLAELSAHGAQPHYRSVDASDPAALRQAVKEVYAAHGRLDGVVFAAGVIDDKVFADKASASFDRVFSTKADGARALLEALADLPEPPRFTVLFGSIAAALGNRGQTDYAAANDALQSQGERWSDLTARRALTVHWGPWAPAGAHAGMVSAELAQDYDRRGIKLIDPAAGTLALLGELAYGDTSVRAVVYTASGW